MKDNLNIIIHPIMLNISTIHWVKHMITTLIVFDRNSYLLINNYFLINQLSTDFQIIN